MKRSRPKRIASRKLNLEFEFRAARIDLRYYQAALTKKRLELRDAHIAIKRLLDHFPAGCPVCRGLYKHHPSCFIYRVMIGADGDITGGQPQFVWLNWISPVGSRT